MSADHTPNSAVVAPKLTSLVAIVAVVVGGVALVGWAFDIAVLKSIQPGWVAMKANTAVCFILIGVALLLTTRQSSISNPHSAILFSRLARFCGLLAGLIGLLTLSEYVFGWNLGIDQWLIREPAGTVGTSHPGRMAPETAMNFVLLSVALWITGGSRQTRRIIRARWTVLASVSLGLLVTTLALAALLAYATPALGLYGWFGLNIIAVHAAILFVMLGVAVTAISWRQDVLQWSLGRNATVALACGMAVLVLIGLSTNRSQHWLKEANYRLAQNEEVLHNIMDLRFDVVDAQAHVRGYVITGNEQLKIDYLEAKTYSNVKLDALRKLMAGSPHQQQQYAQIEIRVNEDLQWLQQAVDFERASITDAARSKRVAHGEDLLDNLRVTFDQIESEHRQLAERLKRESKSMERLSNNIIFIGTFVSLMIFLIVIFRLNFAVSESKQAGQALKKSEDLLNEMGRLAKVGGWEFNVGTREVVWTEEVYRIHEVDMTYKPTVDTGIEFYAPASRPIIARAVQRAIEYGEPYDAVLEFITAKGNHRWVQTSGKAYQEHGKTLTVYGMFQDITERKSAEIMLHNSEARLQTIVENLSEGLAVSDLDGQLLHFNRAALDLHGFTTLDECRQHLSKFADTFELSAMDGTVLSLDQWPLARVLRGENLHNLEVRIRHIQAGWQRIFNYGGTLVRDAAGQPLMAIVTISDITERKQAEAEIRQLNAELEQRVAARTAELEIANKELEAFAYSVSHDLRAPLRAIDGFSRKVVMGYGDKLDDEGRRQLQVVRDNAQSMGQLIDDLLAFSRMSRREMALQPLDMDAMVKGVADELRAAEPQRAIEFVFSPLPCARGDAAMLRQVWVNLLANAAKFSRQRQVAHIEIGGRTESGEAIYWVKDDGAGFDMQYANKLFGVFQRLHRQDEFEGTGVGLAITQRILHRHNGRIWGEGKPDEGATFWFALPISAVIPAQAGIQRK
ncbi:MAG: ATP-binding protein [Sulfuricellaceae bacterium]